MAKRHGAREQKRLAKQKSKRKAKRRQLAVHSSPDPAIRLKPADRWPVVDALVPENLWTTGIGSLLIARRTPDGQLACAVFLVDVFCLGVKEAMWTIVAPPEFKAIRKKLESNGRFEDVKPEYFAKLLYRAADYGQSLDFPPHHDFRHAQRLLAGIDPSQCPDEFEFGQHGRPHYIRGPYESLEESRIIAARVEAAGGHYTLPLDSAEIDEFDLVAEELDDYDEDEDEAESMTHHQPDDQPRRRSWLPWR